MAIRTEEVVENNWNGFIDEKEVNIAMTGIEDKDNQISVMIGDQSETVNLHSFAAKIRNSHHANTSGRCPLVTISSQRLRHCGMFWLLF